MNGKGSGRRPEDNKKVRENWPKGSFVPQWKKDLEKIRESNNKERR